MLYLEQSSGRSPLRQFLFPYFISLFKRKGSLAAPLSNGQQVAKFPQRMSSVIQFALSTATAPMTVVFSSSNISSNQRVSVQVQNCLLSFLPPYYTNHIADRVFHQSDDCDLYGRDPSSFHSC